MYNRYVKREKDSNRDRYKEITSRYTSLCMVKYYIGFNIGLKYLKWYHICSIFELQ